MATDAVERVWFDRTGSTVDLGHFTDRELYTVYQELSGENLRVYWTDDGTPTGTSLFDSTLMPLVNGVIQAGNDARAFSTQYLGGPMVKPERETFVNAYGYETSWDSTNSVWFTKVFRRGDSSSSSGGGATNSSARLVLHALGKGA